MTVGHNPPMPAFFFSFAPNPSPKKPKNLNLGSDWCWTCSLGSEIWKENQKRKGRSKLDPSTSFIPDLANLPFCRTCQVWGEAQRKWKTKREVQIGPLDPSYPGPTPDLANLPFCRTCQVRGEVRRKWKMKREVQIGPLDPSYLGPTPDLANLPFCQTCQVRGEARVRWELTAMVLRSFTLPPSLPSSDLFFSPLSLLFPFSSSS
jgi:hypothetical protein